MEVTGQSQPTCKKVMDSLVHGMLKIGIGEEKLDNGIKPNNVEYSPRMLVLEPVKVVDPEGKLYVVYPSKVDLLFDDIKVARESSHE